MNAAELRVRLRKRHQAIWPGTAATPYAAPGEWVCLEEWADIDLVAFRCWGNCERIGYEIKVSRSDMRKELLRPEKREPYKRHVDRLYLAVPDALLKPAELAYQQPTFEPADFLPEWCTNPDCRFGRSGGPHRYARSARTPKHKGKSYEGACVHLGHYTDKGENEDGSTYYNTGSIEACCAVCKGRGKVAPSRVEREAPTLWIPPDVGLVTVSDRGCRTVRKAPKLEPPVALGQKALHDLIRWASFRPDPRHTLRDHEQAPERKRAPKPTPAVAPALDENQTALPVSRDAA